MFREGEREGKLMIGLASFLLSRYAYFKIL